MSIEERLTRIEEMLVELIKRLERLEEFTIGSSKEARIAVDLVLAFSKPVQEALKLSHIIIRGLSKISGEDSLARAIIEALAVHGPLTLRGLEREVRRLRGKASRSRIKAKLSELEAMGIVEIVRRGRRMVIRLAIEE